MTRDAGPVGPAELLAQGAMRGVALEQFRPVWDTARLRLARASWSQSDLTPFLGYDVPYTGTSSGRLSEDAAEVFLATAPAAGDLRVLELGSGSGVFARLFLDRLRDVAPDVYSRTTYLVTDGSAAILAAQAAHGILDAHRDRIETRVLDASKGRFGSGEFDAILGTYVLDSLPFDLLAVNDRRTWRKECRSVLDAADTVHEGQLRDALRAEDSKDLAGWAWIGPRLGLQARHVAIDRATLSHGDTLPRDTGGQTLPFVHCHGVLSCLDACRSALKPGGAAIFSDYGHLSILPAHEFLEFQAFGNSVAVGVNFLQLTAAAEAWPDAQLVGPEEEEGSIYTRVLHRTDASDGQLNELVSRLYGAPRFRALNDPLDKARAMLKSRHHEAARSFYREALEAQPRNWALMEEVATTLLTVDEEHEAAVEMANLGLALNPLAPGLWLARAEAMMALGRRDAARDALEHVLALAPARSAAWRVLAGLDFAEDRFGPALDAIAEGLKRDRDGDEQEELLQIQGQVLAAMLKARHSDVVAAANQMRLLDGLPE